MANVLLGGNQINNIFGVELENADVPGSYVRFFSANYSAGNGITIVNDVIAIKTTGAHQNDLMTLDASGNIVWYTPDTYVALTSAEVTNAVNNCFNYRRIDWIRKR